MSKTATKEQRIQHVISTMMTPEEIHDIKKYLYDTGMKKGEMVRMAIAEYIKTNKQY